MAAFGRSEKIGQFWLATFGHFGSERVNVDFIIKSYYTFLFIILTFFRYFTEHPKKCLPKQLCSWERPEMGMV